jgi:hypothetical protein
MATKRIKDLSTSITAFRTGDYIAVDGTSGTAKMSKDDLLNITADNAQTTGISSTDFSLSELTETSESVGFMKSDGVINSSFTEYKCTEFAVSGDSFYAVTSSYSGSQVYGIIEKDSSDNILARHYLGVNSLKTKLLKCVFKTNASTAKVFVNSKNVSSSLYSATPISATSIGNMMNVKDAVLDERIDSTNSRIDAVNSDLDVEKTAYNYTKLTETSSGTGIVRENGNVDSAFTTYKYREYSVSGSKEYAVTSTYNGGIVYGIIEKNSSNVVVAKHFQGKNGAINTTRLQECIFKTTASTTKIFINCFDGYEEELYSISAITASTISNKVNIVKKDLSNLEWRVSNAETTLSKVDENVTDASTSFAYSQVTSDSDGVGFVRNNGTIESAFTDYHYAKFAVSTSTKYAITCRWSGVSVWAVLELNSSNTIVAYHYQGVNGPANMKYLDRYTFTTRADTAYLIINNQQTTSATLETATKKDETSIRNVVNMLLNDAMNTNNTSYFKGKKIVWLGTSIPAQGYPLNCGTIIGANVVNEALGSSMARRGRYDHSLDPLDDNYLGVNGVSWQNVMRSLSMTQEEKHYIMECWTTAGRKQKLIDAGYTAEQVASVKGFVLLLGGDFYGGDTDPTEPTGDEPIDIMDDDHITMRKAFLSSCWNNSTDIEAGFGTIYGKLEKYFNSSEPDVWVLDHGHNDGLRFDTDSQLEDVPSDPLDRFSFVGAMDYIITKILQYNPRAKVFVIGHYTNQVGGTNRPVQICNGQVNFATKWQIPLFKIWERLPFSQSVITTTGYWDNSGVWHNSGFNGTNHHGGNLTPDFNQNPRQVDGVWVHDLTMKQVYMQDDLHPKSTDVKQFYGMLIADWMNSVYERI